MKTRQSLFYTLKEKIFGSKFADSFLNQSERKLMNEYKAQSDFISSAILSRIKQRET